MIGLLSERRTQPTQNGRHDVTPDVIVVSVDGHVLPQPVRGQHVKVDAHDMRYLFIVAGVVLCVSMLQAQAPDAYCNVSSAMAYSLKMPGISRFQLNDIDRGSLAVECGLVMCNSYVPTGVSTTLEQGTEYTVSITHTRDDDFFPDARNNLRIWIDWDQDAVFNEASETAVLRNYAEVGTTTATFTVPANAKLGTTRLRATAKMSDDAGHSIPTPCDIPPDPIGYHGEIEDYTVEIVATGTSVDESNVSEPVLSVYPQPVTDNATITSSEPMLRMEIIDLMGNVVRTLKTTEHVAILQRDDLPTGRYILRAFGTSGTVHTMPLLLLP